MVTMHFYKSLNSLCFSDFDVLGIEIDEEEKIFQITVEGVWLKQDEGEPKELGKGYIKINGFKEIQAKYSNSVKKSEGDASFDQIKEIKEINDREAGFNYLKLFGFINDGSWVECKITGGQVEAEFDE